MTDSQLEELNPPDDTGVDTFSRYIYQACCAVPYCLNCYLDTATECVVIEHIEDIVVKENGKWRFIQIKTRNNNRGPWKFSDLAGPLKSLHRSHRAIGDHPVTLELHIEGSLKPDDVCYSLRTAEGKSEVALMEKVEQTLGINRTECTAFLQKVKVVEGLPAKDVVVARNLRLIGSQARHLTVDAIESIHEEMIQAISNIMGSETLDPSWLSVAFDAGQENSERRRIFDSRKFSREDLIDFAASVDESKSIAKTIWRKFDDSDWDNGAEAFKRRSQRATDRDRKNSEDECRQSVIETFFSTLITAEDALEDLQIRLRTEAWTAEAVHANDANPAIGMWRSLMDTFRAANEFIDPNRVLKRDPYLLLGQVLSMTENCEVSWGTTDA